jgi:uncharacterized heparinase superfamily protein
MMPGRMSRIRQLTFEEARWRTRELAATLGDRIRFRVRRPEWPNTCDSSTVTDVIERLREGHSCCVIDPHMAPVVRQEILGRFPNAVADAAMRGDRLLGGQYDLLGYRGLAISDWHSDPVHHRRAPLVCWAEVPYLDPSIGDHKIIWELNRHQYWLQLGRAYWLTDDSRYARAIVDQLENWLEANPPLTGINWASMLEIGLRAISWTMAIHFLIHNGDIPFPTARCLAALERQLTHVEKHLSYFFSPNTHLTGEALALYVVGQAFPELDSGKRWVETGRRILLREIDRQILRDGGHAERSMHYQRYTLDFYLLALLTARRAGDIDAERAFAEAAARLAEFTYGIADHEGRLPLIGDDDGGMLWPVTGRDCADVRDSLATAAVVLNRPHLAGWELQEETFWMAAPEAIAFVNDPARTIDAAARTLSPLDAARGDREPVGRSGPRPQAFPDTGYVVMRSDHDHAVLDTGAHGYMNGGHAHADALSLTLSIGGRPLLIDPGTATYTMDPQLRDRMRGSLNHNTVCVDGNPQSIPAGPFHWATTADARLHASRHNGCFDWAEATHDGYAPVQHRRSIIRADGSGWLIVDEVRSTDVGGDGDAIRSAATHWHFHPGWMLRDEGMGVLRATHLEGVEASLLFDVGDLSLVHGDEESGLGWYAPVYGTLLPTWSVRVTRSMRLPFSMLSWIDAATACSTPDLQRITANADPYGEVIAARVVNGDFASVYLLRPGEPPSRDGRACGTLDYQTDARVLHFRTQGEALVALDLIDASHALALCDGWLSIATSEPVRDLHVQLNDDVLELCATEPPRQLRILGAALLGLRTIRLNGRSHPLVVTDPPDTLLVSGAEWTATPLVRLGVRFALDEMHPSRV